MTHAHTSGEKLGINKRIALSKWILGAELWLLGLLAMQFITLGKIIVAEERGEQLVSMNNMLLPVVVGMLAIYRSWLEELKHHPEKWMVVGTICYWIALVMLFVVGAKDAGTGVVLLWWGSTITLFVSFNNAGGHH